MKAFNLNPEEINDQFNEEINDTYNAVSMNVGGGDDSIFNNIFYIKYKK